MTKLRSAILIGIAFAGILGALAFFWVTRRDPLAWPPIFYFDALGAFFMLAVWCGAALLLLTHRDWRVPAVAALLTPGFLTAFIPLIVIIYLALAVTTIALARRANALARATPALSILALATGYGLLIWRGILRLDALQAGAALDSLVFWCVLLAATLPLLPRFAAGRDTSPAAWLFAFAWLYPLARLYTLGPWNEGWSFATLTLGGGALLWISLSALTAASATERRVAGRQRFLAAALAGIGLSSGAGIAAGCYAILTFLLLAALDGGSMEEPETTSQSVAPSVLPAALPAWLLSGAIPLSAPFIAVWMLIGAGAAGGVSLLAATAWFAALLGAATVAITPTTHAPRAAWISAAASLALGVAAPLVTRLFIQPVIEQLQGGLSVYGDINIWPWVGLAASNSARTGITALPTIGVAGLMLVLSAMVYLLARWFRPTVTDSPGVTLTYAEVLDELRRVVPWLGDTPAKARNHDDR